MISHTISKTPLASNPDQTREQLEDLACTLAAEDAAPGQQHLAPAPAGTPKPGQAPGAP